MTGSDEHREQVLRAAFELREHLLAYARSLLGNYAAAEDAVQEAFLVVVKKHENFQEGTSLLAWCRAIVRIEVLKAKDRYHRDRSLIERVLDDSVDAAFEEFQKSRSQMDADRRRDALADCVEMLSEQAQGVLQARMADELGYPQIGERLSMSIEAVRKSLFRSKKQVRECVESKLRPI
ncbi:RNA polymerase sigma factor [Stieleria neptunia]|uniref:RNA polymerase sigma factor n=1 Tax=Stieleria neptunia TaxID=2527979 RepID=A0A518I303_9BACT|nr:sigma-70 family RNA polymerase sigma factor [Stieleria neptunia]QDV47482.1 RNA polymerase sigma factor [Stieleria neptunia]